MSSVVDASLLVAAVADAGIEGAWAEVVVTDGPLLSPHLVHAEVTNILRRLELANRLTAFEASSAQRDLMLLDLELFPFEPFAERVWELRGNVTSYDAWYVAIAEALEVPLATLDRRLARATGPSCRFLLPE